MQIAATFSIVSAEQTLTVSDLEAAAQTFAHEMEAAKVWYVSPTSAFACSKALILAARHPERTIILGHDSLAHPSAAKAPLPAQSGFYTLTSGTTGAPKLIKQNIDELAGSVARSQTTDATWLLTFSPGSFASVQVIISAMVSGHIIHDPLEHDFTTIRNTFTATKPSHVSGTPSFWRNLLLFTEASNWDHLKFITLGGEICDQLLLDQLAARCPSAIIQHIYASSEAGACFAVKDGKEGFPKSWLTCPPKNVKPISVSPDGELLVRRYIPNETDIEDFIQTGDLVSVGDNRVTFIGRLDHQIKVGGQLVSLEKVERCLRDIDMIKDIIIIPRSSPIVGYILSAKIVIKSNLEEDEARRELAVEIEKLPAPERPRIIEIVDFIQEGRSGKRQRLPEGDGR